MEHILELARARRSVRSFDGGELGAEERQALLGFAETIENPWGLPVEFRLLDAAEHKLSSPVITGERWYLGAKIKAAPHMEEAFGYSFEAAVLYAWSLGLGTTWIGGTMDRAVFARAMELQSGERMPCVSPLGRPAARMSLRETVMRRGVKADWREDFSAVFFDGDFSRPLSEAEAGVFAAPLCAVRHAPSAVNRQPWRVVRRGDGVHFYCRHARGYVSAATGDLQKVDLGIAICHFALCAREQGLALDFSLADPGVLAPPDTEYIASFTLPQRP